MFLHPFVILFTGGVFCPGGSLSKGGVVSVRGGLCPREGLCPLPRVRLRAGGTHPTGMHSCFQIKPSKHRVFSNEPSLRYKFYDRTYVLTWHSTFSKKVLFVRLNFTLHFRDVVAFVWVIYFLYSFSKQKVIQNGSWLRSTVCKDSTHRL